MLAIDLNVNPLLEPYVPGGKHIVVLERSVGKLKLVEEVIIVENFHNSVHLLPRGGHRSAHGRNSGMAFSRFPSTLNQMSSYGIFYIIIFLSFTVLSLR